jgi:hypothetical protein
MVETLNLFIISFDLYEFLYIFYLKKFDCLKASSINPKIYNLHIIAFGKIVT